MTNIFEAELERLASIDNRKPMDYEQDGILHCGICHEPKQAWIEWIPDAEGKREKRLVPVTCRCYEEEERREREKIEAQKFKERLGYLRDTICGGSQDFIKQTFAVDDSADSAISRTCRSYVAQWNKMLTDNMGILFYGSKGTGKSFYAACIANALAEKRITTAMTSTAQLMTVLAKWDKEEVMDAIRRVRLLVLDDLGAERDTTYSAEIMYNVINERSKTGRPTIITSNFALADMQAETDIWRSRIYDRVIEMCPIAIKMQGESRRSAAAEERRKIAREILAAAMKGEE